MNGWRTLHAFASPHRALLVAGACLMLCESATALALPWVGGWLAGDILGAAGWHRLRIVLLVLLGLFALLAGLRFASAYVLESVADRIVGRMKTALYDHLQALPVEFYHRRRLGEVLALLTTDVYEVSAFISGTAVALVPLLVTAAGAVVLMWGIRAELALVAALLVPLFYLLFKICARGLRPLAIQLQAEEAGAVAIAQENLSLLPAIKAFTREAHESARYRDQIGRILALSARQRLALAALAPLAQFVASAGVVVLLAMASGDLVEGRLTPAQLVAFLLYASLLARPVAGLADVYGRAQRVRGALSRLQSVMTEPPEQSGAAGAPAPELKGDIEFQRVSFGYHGRPVALDRVDLRIRQGETVALVGPNGAGKSTLGYLLMRLHDPAGGRILIGETDIASIPLAGLRGQIGLVPQHVLLFNASVRENIAYGRVVADAAAVESAARAAQAHDFIVQLPQGYDTVIGDRGVRLSGGQQQRVALARALLKDPPILILDEATAMFDPESEEDFLCACHESFERRTVIFITHRPASLRKADRIVHMREGRIERIEARADRTPRLVAGA